MGSRGPRRIHPVAREAAIERRAVLRAMGIGAGALALGGVGALAGCGGDDPRRAGTRATPTTDPTATTIGGRPAAGVAAYDPDVNYWEQGAFAPVQDESTVTDLRVTGTIPSDLSGLYVRNGSNSTTGRSPHWFMG